jgi:regulator of sigma E protease
LASYIQMAVVFILVLGSMVVIHEFGHFIVAKFFGIRVDVFSVGFGKRLFGLKRGDTDYRVSLIPLGGYVKMAGENLDEQITGAPDEFMSKPKWQRFCVAIAGPVANIITAIAIPATIAMIHHEVPIYLNQPVVVKSVDVDSPASRAGIQPDDVVVGVDGQENPNWRDLLDFVAVHPDQKAVVTVKRGDETRPVNIQLGARDIEGEKIGYAGLKPDVEGIIVADVLARSPAAAAGLKPGDQIVGVNGTDVPQTPDGTKEVIKAIQDSQENPVTLTVNRDDQTLEIQATPQLTDGNYRLGFTQTLGFRAKTVATRLSLGDALRHSVDENWRIIKLTKTAIGQIFTGDRKATETVTGPVGIAKLTGQAAQAGTKVVFELMAVLSLNLGIFNLLPIPVLDGGLIFMLLLEAVLGLFGLSLTMRVKEKMMQVGMVMLMLLMGFVIFNDISKLMPGKKVPAQQQVEQPTPDSK